MQKLKYLILLTLLIRLTEAWSDTMELSSGPFTNEMPISVGLSGCSDFGYRYIGAAEEGDEINIYGHVYNDWTTPLHPCRGYEQNVEFGPYASGSYTINYYIYDEFYSFDKEYVLQASQMIEIEKVSVNEPPTGRILISGEAIEDQVVTASHILSDANGMGDVEYQWYRNGELIPGAVYANYLLIDDDVHQDIRVTASYVDGLGKAESVSTLPLSFPDRIENINDEPVGSVYIRGSLSEGSTLTIDTSGLYDADGIDSLSYQWIRRYKAYSAAGEAVGLDIDTYVLTDNDRYQSITAVVSYRDSHGTYERVEANVTGPVVLTDRPIVTPPADLSLPATGTLTQVDVGEATARDDQGETFDTFLSRLVSNGVDTPVPANGPLTLQPGTHLLTWSVDDGNYVSGEAIQIVRVDPIITSDGDRSVTPAGPFDCPLILNGPVARYPVTVPYTLSGVRMVDQSELLLQEGVLIINGDEQQPAIRIPDYVVGDATEYQSLRLVMDQSTNAVMGDQSSCRIVLNDQNFPPRVTLTASQEGGVYRIVSQADGPVTVTSTVEDLNIEDTHTYDWSETDQGLVDTDSEVATLTFDPASLEPGLYRVSLEVSDGSVIRGAELSLRVVAARPVLTVADSDGDGETDRNEGEGDRDSDGIPDYLDHAGWLGNILLQEQGNAAQYLMETEPGLKLALGDIAFYAQRHGAMITGNDILDYINSGLGGAADSEAYPYEGGLFDFRINGIPEAGSSVKVVIPQRQAIEPDSTYRKLMPTGWQGFVTDDRNEIRSAPGEAGQCPPPGDSTYTEGLMEGAWCVELTIEDGGPNDADGEENETIADPGGVTTTLSADGGSDGNSGADSQSSGGGGAFSLWVLLPLVLLTLMYRSALCSCRRSGLTS